MARAGICIIKSRDNKICSIMRRSRAHYIHLLWHLSQCWTGIVPEARKKPRAHRQRARIKTDLIRLSLFAGDE